MDAAWEALSLVPTLALILATPAVLNNQASKASCVENARDRQWTSKIVSRSSAKRIPEYTNPSRLPGVSLQALLFSNSATHGWSKGS